MITETSPVGATILHDGHEITLVRFIEKWRGMAIWTVQDPSGYEHIEVFGRFDAVSYKGAK